MPIFPSPKCGRCRVFFRDLINLVGTMCKLLVGIMFSVLLHVMVLLQMIIHRMFTSLVMLLLVLRRDIHVSQLAIHLSPATGGDITHGSFSWNAPPHVVHVTIVFFKVVVWEKYCS